MSLARAVTRRIKRSHSDASRGNPSAPPRSETTSPSPVKMIDRSKISLPIALVSTTNMLSYNAPDISSLRQVSSSTSSTHSSAEDSDHSISTRSRASTLTDASSVDTSPISPAQHALGFPPSHGKTLKKSASTTSLQQVKEEPAEITPAIPQRALSHSKRAHERLAQKRSLQSMTVRSSTGSVRHSREHRSSSDVSATVIREEPHPHPFGRELEQLNEIVEEFGGVVRDAETEADLTAMRARNLAAFCAADYLAEIRPLYSSHIGFSQHQHQQPAMAWI